MTELCPTTREGGGRAVHDINNQDFMIERGRDGESESDRERQTGREREGMGAGRGR